MKEYYIVSHKERNRMYELCLCLYIALNQRNDFRVTTKVI